RTIGYCIMPNHWHLVLWPREDGDLSAFIRWLTLTHTQRVHARHGTAGSGHIYQGRFKSFLIEQTRPPAALRAMGVLEGGDAVLSVLRYVERNALKAGLATRAEAWPWCSAHARLGAKEAIVPLTAPPGGLPEDWIEWVNRPHTDKELAALQRSVERGVPFGREPWVKRMAAEWGLESTLRPRGRPRKAEQGIEKGRSRLRLR
ncbi:MAG: transposase, partial [Planctomycetaceae bacterium]|nr:transposase [Planctomycetaceae bacterium]